MENTSTNNNEIKENKPRISEERLIDENYIKIPNVLWDDLSMSNDELTIFILLQRNSAMWRANISITSIKMLTDYMYIDTNKNKNIVTDIKKTIISLLEKEFITNLYDIHYKEIYVKYKTVDDNEVFDKFFIEEVDKETGEVKEIEFDMDKNTLFYVMLQDQPDNDFLMLQDIKIDKIFKKLQGTNLSKYSLIRYYIACCRVSNNEQNFGYLSQSKLKSLVTDSRTIQRYNQVLHENELIRYCSDYWTPEKHYTTTFIGKWEDDIKNFEFQIECMVEEKGLIPTDKTACNKKRSVKKKINNVEKEIANTDNMIDIEKYKELEAKYARLQQENEKLKYIPKDTADKHKGLGHFGNKRPKSNLYNNQEKFDSLFKS